MGMSWTFIPHNFLFLFLNLDKCLFWRPQSSKIEKHDLTEIRCHNIFEYSLRILKLRSPHFSLHFWSALVGDDDSTLSHIVVLENPFAFFLTTFVENKHISCLFLMLLEKRFKTVLLTRFNNSRIIRHQLVPYLTDSHLT